MWLALRRLRWARRVAASPLQACWREPLPGRRCDWRALSFLVCDAEMSSLDPRQGELLSLGWVTVAEGAVQLGTARHQLIASEHGVGQSATIHQIHDRELAAASPPAAAMAALLQAAAGKVLVLHHAPLDLAYLNRLSRQLYGASLLLPVVDTLALERAQRERRGSPLTPGALTLQACRAHYGLPDHGAHNALQDALATAELLLAQIARRSAGGRFTLGDLR
ncbi:3'-5' exonuclease [Haliea sp. E1-2-M8]|uniref:3'-5' exonuclease n=1 Tax=Haliea sp. E1-2-M8 TaxID=3064706 RepID=UPI0027256D3B|nr:3'-5' exonuclease [Haliea sp. E1-2-M8]MDO8862554.1 3'-5' exonuclease [Haliea sp. E1-2-M8]